VTGLRRFSLLKQEVSVDYGYFGEKQLSEIPLIQDQFHDPSGILTRELESRVRDEVVRKAARDHIGSKPEGVGLAQIALAEDPYSALAWVTSASQWLAEIFHFVGGFELDPSTSSKSSRESYNKTAS